MAEGDAYRAPLALDEGRWRVEVTTATGPAYRVETVLSVRAR